jgi:protein O-GlcNAc transferase
MPQLTIQQAFELALRHHQADQLQQAEQIYRQILAQQPKHAEALHLLGVIAYQGGRYDLAVDLILQAIALNPAYPEAYSNLGVALKDQGQLDAALAAYRQAIALQPSYPEAHYNLGVVLRDMGQPDAAIAAFRQALVLQPNYSQAYGNLGVALSDKGQLDEAIAAYRQALALNPRYPEAYSNLGVALSDKGQLDAAIAAYRQALALKPDDPEAYSNLSNALRDQGQLDAAVTACRQALALKPNFAEAYVNLGTALQAQGQLDAAAAAYRQALTLKFNFPDAHNNLGNVLKDQGELDAAIAAFRQALALAPNNARFHSNLVYTLHYHPAYDAPVMTREHQLWNRQHAAPLRQFIQPHPNDRSPERRLRVGYVSPDFRNHCQALFTIPLLAHHDHAACEIFCYASVTRPDDYTRRLAGYTDVWRDVRSLNDAALCERIRADGIDILVDLTMHMAHGRPLLFARKPAPIQVAWLAYPGTTGLDAIDYRFTDPYLDPPEPGVDALYTEKSLRLPATFWCYDPLENPPPDVGPLPALANGYVTFGCLNNFCKVNDGVLKLWARVLAGVADSRLVLLAEEGSHRERSLTVLEDLGVSRQRVRFEVNRPRHDYLKLYQQIDIGLDTQPYNGHTTSLDSYFMGVPVVTLAQLPQKRLKILPIFE